MNDLKELSLPYNSFISGYFMPEHISDNIINFANKNIKDFTPGKVGNQQIKKNIKDSLDYYINLDTTEIVFLEYLKYLNKILHLYIEKYKELKYDVSYFNLVENINLQYYKPGCGFKKMHCERTSTTKNNRLLVFMTYLNDVPNGGTNFKYQNLTTPSLKGLTLIWPTDWTHTHCGQISNTHEKYILTGWFGFSNE